VWVLIAAAAPSQVTPAPTIGCIGKSSIALSWTAAAPNGAPISGYEILMQTGGAGSFAVYIPTTDSAATNLSIAGLLPGVQYAFQVAGINESGIGPTSAASASVRTLGAAVLTRFTRSSFC